MCLAIVAIVLLVLSGCASGFVSDTASPMVSSPRSEAPQAGGAGGM